MTDILMSVGLHLQGKITL